MANSSNLIPINKRTKSEARKISQKGGKKSGEARREKKKLRELLENMLIAVDEDGLTYSEKILFALIQKALSGDVKAFEVIRDTVGEKPNDKDNGEKRELPVFNINGVKI